ncbi:SusD/RagB family nutrient-binding outer membrane lipoprotein [Reichenbachiella versicolor]|uniref:SusD/RagB family nutrient-binding outer membrane lipoprotein n=1 Tax=Reichenbachiella versicolor TaxID=1821036 RepID=UPI000D6E24B6|nr:SusD/RagB family nutrient-binding outer membrane lipoprotein [Reichenbachiella versicolor]
MKRIICFLALATVFFSACTDDFESINTNGNQPESVGSEFLLPTIIFDFANINVNEAYNFGDIISQYAANYEFINLDLYRWSGDDRFWSPMYQVLLNIQDVKSQAIADGDQNLEAVALILESQVMSVITDAYGHVPYSEALLAESNMITPSYDNQEDIYNQLFTNLERANSLIDTDGSVKGDILFDGNMAMWQKYANTLRVRLLMHTANVNTNISSNLKAILENPAKYPLLGSTEDDVIYEYSGVVPDVSTVSAVNGGRAYDYFLSVPTTTFIDNLDDNDPRLELFLSPRQCAEGDATCAADRLQGVAPGLDQSNIGRPADYSRRSEEFYNSGTLIQSIWVTYSELNFILAEAREEGYISTGTAKGYYDAAVEASFTQWGLTMPADFLTTTAPYDNTTEVLYEQKWLALYHVGIEAWLDWKRTRKPSFIKAGPGTSNNGNVPVRLFYPADEQSLNAENYENAIKLLDGNDDLNAGAWWWSAN